MPIPTTPPNQHTSTSYIDQLPAAGPQVLIFLTIDSYDVILMNYKFYVPSFTKTAYSDLYYCSNMNVAGKVYCLE
jgi:hypothetical protein